MLGTLQEGQVRSLLFRSLYPRHKWQRENGTSRNMSAFEKSHKGTCLSVARRKLGVWGAGGSDWVVREGGHLRLRPAILNCLQF